MTALTYVVTTSKGTCEVKTLARAKELVEIYGGSYQPKYTKIEGV